MTFHRYLPIQVLLASLLLFNFAARAEQKAPLTKTPTNLKELRDLETKVKAVTKKVISAVVCVQVGDASGSGVIVNEEGYVLTAGHVSGEANRDATLIMSDGKRVKGKTLANNRGVDSGMIKITDAGKWPFAPIGDSKKLEKGQWCVSLGHPGGYFLNRPPVLRLGRVLDARPTTIQTDCTLVGGDSGGPLFDLDGNLIGIHSRIGFATSFNIHVPAAQFVEDWDRLAMIVLPSTGLVYEKLGDMMKISEVEKDSPAEKAGFKAKDLLAKLDGQKVADRDEIDRVLKKRKPGEEVAVEIIRAGEPLTLKLKLGTPKK